MSYSISDQLGTVKNRLLQGTHFGMLTILRASSALRDFGAGDSLSLAILAAVPDVEASLSLEFEPRQNVAAYHCRSPA